MWNILSNYLPKSRIKPFHTYRLGFLIYSLIINSGLTSYLELGYGFGSTILLAGLALKDQTHGNNYRLVGIDKRDNRRRHANKLLNDYGIVSELILGNVFNHNWNENIDALFVDCGNRSNQQLIDKYGKFVNKLIVVHDVDSKLIFPEGFDSIYINNSRCVIAFKSDEPINLDTRICKYQ